MHHTRFLLRLCEELGVVVNRGVRTDTDPAVSVLGRQFELVEYDCTRKRFLKICDRARSAVESRQASARQLQVLLGLLASPEKAVPFGRLHLREIKLCLRQQWDFNPCSDHVRIHLPPAAVAELCWWMQESNVFRGSRINPREPDRHLVTDASGSGWGGHLDEETISGLWSPELQWRHINDLELYAVRLTVVL